MRIAYNTDASLGYYVVATETLIKMDVLRRNSDSFCSVIEEDDARESGQKYVLPNNKTPDDLEVEPTKETLSKMEVLRRNSDSFCAVIEEADAKESLQESVTNIKTPENLGVEPIKAHHRRNSSLNLRRNKAEIDSSIPISIVYNPEEEIVAVSNIVDGSSAIDSSNEPPLPDLDLLLAATYVEDARDGRHSDFKVSEKHLKLYHMYQSTWGQALLYLIIGVHLLLALFEKPAVPGLEMAYWAAMTIEVGIMVFYLVRLMHINFFTPVTRFWSDTKNLLILALIGLTFLDMVIYVGLVESGNYGVRWSRPLRPLFAINFPEMRQIRRSFRNLRRTLPDVANVLFLFFFSLAIFALMAYKLFGGRGLQWVDGRPYFETYWDSVFDLYVLVTTANNPDIMMPAFDESVYYVLFFVIFLVICFFVYMNIILAVIYNNYRKHLKNEVKKMVYSKRQQLSKAFNLLALNVESKKIVTRKRFMLLLQKIHEHINPALINVLWIVLDSDGSEGLEKVEFLKLADLLNVEVSEVVSRTTLIAHFFPKVYYSKPSKILCYIVKHKFFQAFFDVLTLINAIVIGIATNQSTWDDVAEWVFLSLFMLEIILKLYAYGFRRFFKRMWNVFDFVVIGAAFIMGIVEAVVGDENESRVSLDVLLVLRVLRLVKIIGNINRFKVIVHTISKIVPSLLTYGVVIMVFYYMFAIIGMESFQGLVIYTGYDVENGDELFCGNDKLENTDFWHDHYCNNNFNDIIHAFIVMFELTVVNQWHVIAYGYATVTDPWARLYFMLFHLICVIIGLNIFTAFVLEVFILEYTASQTHLQSELEKKIQEMGLNLKKKSVRKSSISEEHLVESDSDSSGSEDEPDGNENPEAEGGTHIAGASRFYPGFKDISGETDVRFHISKRLRNVEVLLQKMFEKEIDIGELGPNIVDMDHDLEDNQKFTETQDRTNWHLGNS